RWVTDCKPGEGKYLATYELESPAVLQSGDYLKRFENQTPWSRRCLSKCVVFRRWACEQTGGGPPDPAARSLFVIFDKQIPITNVRELVASAGEPKHITLVESSSLQPPAIPGARLYRAYS